MGIFAPVNVYGLDKRYQDDRSSDICSFCCYLIPLLILLQTHDNATLGDVTTEFALLNHCFSVAPPKDFGTVFTSFPGPIIFSLLSLY